MSRHDGALVATMARAFLATVVLLAAVTLGSAGTALATPPDCDPDTGQCNPHPDTPIDEVEALAAALWCKVRQHVLHEPCG